MPLRAVLDQRDIQAFDYSSEEWTALKGTYRNSILVTACCGHKAIPKTSPLGTQFFAHARRGDCTSAPETKEHLLAKTIIAKAAKAAGWQVITEAPGLTPDGESWIADVLCQRGNARVALETQWSAQTLASYRQRQDRYRRAGVRTAWFVRRLPNNPERWGEARSTAELPMFQLQANEAASGFTVEPFGAELGTFVTRMLSGALRWEPKPGREYELRINLAQEACWRCSTPTNVITAITLHHLRYGQVGYQMVAHTPAAYELLRAHLTPHHHQQLRLGSLKQRHSRTVGRAYLSQGCYHCDALMGDWHIMELTLELASGGELGEGIPIGTVTFAPDLQKFFPPDWRYAATPGPVKAPTTG